jgi:SPP1 gp7 family putative phage head morphogenesis protein
MRLFFQNKQEITQNEQPPKKMFSQQTLAESPLYENYNFRPYNPDDIFQKRGDYSLFDEMREDEQISALLTLKKFLIISGKWDIECEDEEVTEFLKFNLEICLDEIFEKKLLNILSCLDYGFSLTEKVFEYKDTEWGNKIVLSKLLTRPPHTFEIPQESDGTIKMFQQDNAGKKIDIVKEKFIHYVFQGEFDNPYGRSELNLGVYRAWWSKNAIIKFWNIYLERFGMPTIVGTYPSGLTKVREDLEAVLKNVQAKTSITIPEGVKIDLLQAASKGESEFEKAIDKYNIMIARKMLIPDLMGMAGEQTAGGSYSLGQEQFRMFYNNIEFETRNLEAIINKEIINPLVLWNFGKEYEAKFKINRTDIAQRQNDMKIWIEGVKTGKIPVNFDAISWFLQNINAPEIDEAEFDKMEEEKKAMAEQIQGGGELEEKEKPGDKKPFEKPTEKESAEKPEDKKKINKFAMKREKTKYEEKIDFEKIDNTLTDIEERYSVLLSNQFKLSINALMDEVRRRKIVENKRFDLINKLSLKYRVQIKKIVFDMLKESRDAGTDLAITRTNFIINIKNKITPEEVAQWLEGNSLYITDVEEAEILKKVKGTLADSIRSGLGFNNIVKMLNKDLEGYGLGGARLETIARTNVMKAFSESRKQELESTDGIVAYQLSAIMDDRTSDICDELDGLIFEPEDLDYYNTPLHFNCRSIIIPIFQDEEFEFDEMPNTESTQGGFLTLVGE